MSTVFLSSCQLPPQEAWRDIKEEGLIPFIADSFRGSYPHHENTPGSAAPALPPQPAAPDTSALAQNTEHAHPAAPEIPPQPEAPHSIVSSSSTPPPPIPAPPPTPPAPHLAPAPDLDTHKIMTAQSVPSLPGFVRSPYTNPPRLVDVKGATPGSTMVCPYTHRPFVIPNDYKNPPSNLASEETDRNGPPTPTVSPINPEKLPQANVVNHTASAESHPSTPKVASTPPPTEKAPTTVQPLPQPTPPAPGPKPNVQDIPYGTPIAGRPGLVYSPFADKNKVVDVTGLPVGMEVKCPYTGKLFRVPPQDLAVTKPADQPQTLASPPPQQPQKK